METAPSTPNRGSTGIIRQFLEGVFCEVRGNSPKFEQKVTKKCAEALRDAYGDVACLSACYRDAGPGIRAAEVLASKHDQRSQDLGGGNEDAGGSGASLTRRRSFCSTQEFILEGISTRPAELASLSAGLVSLRAKVIVAQLPPAFSEGGRERWRVEGRLLRDAPFSSLRW